MQGSKAYRKIVRILPTDELRFKGFLATLPENRDAFRFLKTDEEIKYLVRLNKQELLYIELAFKVDVKKIRGPKKKQPTSPYSIFKT